MQSRHTYTERTAGSTTVYLPATTKTYANENTTGDLTTSYAYTYFTGTVQAESVTTTDPAGDATVVFNDIYGRPIWTKDPAGFLTYTAYDPATGAIVKTVTDVDTTQTSTFTSKPTGWTTPSGGGLHLTTTHEVDGQGRPTTTTDANGNITYTVYNDANHETRVYPGWNTVTNTTTGPTIVTREDRARGYTEQLAMSATPAVSGGRPTGTEAISSLQSLSRTYVNAAGQAVRTDDYFSFAGMSYSVNTYIGTLNTNYYTSTTAYDGRGRVNRTVRGDGTIYRTVYDAKGRVASQWIGTNDTPASGEWSPSNPAGMIKVAENVYDGGGVGDGNVTSSSDALARATTYAYDFRNRLSTTTLPDPDGAGPLTSPVNSTTYDNLDRVLTQTDSLTHVTSYAYSAPARTTTITFPDPDGGGPLASPVVVNTSNSRGQLASATDPLSHVTAYAYDGAGRQKSVTQPDPDGAGPLTAPVTQYQYDGVGNVRFVTDPLSHVTESQYDKSNRLFKTIEPDPDGAGSLLSPIITYAYDAAGLRQSLTDPVNNVTTWQYDALGRVTSETNELNKTRSYEYDGASRLTQKTDRLGRMTQYVYNALDGITAEKWYDGAVLVRTISSTYNDAGELTQVTDPAATYGFNYDNDGRVKYESQSFAGFSSLIDYYRAFNADSSVLSLAAVVAGTADFKNVYSYDNLARLTSVNQQQVTGGNAVAAKRADFAYDANSRVTKLTRYADATGTEFVANTFSSYDDIGRLKQLTHSMDATAPSSGWGTSPLAGYQYTLDAASRITSLNSYQDGVTNYTLDNTDQLLTADHTGQTDESYSYDANGNRTMSGYSTTTNNRLSSDGTYNYTYDDEGNRLTKTTIATGAKEEYTWDWRNRLTAVTFKNSGGTVLKTVTDAYDYLNQWIRRTVDNDGPGPGAAADTFFSNLAGQVALQFAGSAASNLSHRYFSDPIAIDHLLADEAVTSLASPGAVQYPLGDHLGTLRDLASHNSTTHITSIDNHRRYDDYGNLVSESNAAVDQLFGYTGRAFDDATGLQNNVNRWYDMTVGRWLSEDPIGFGGDPSNPYRYAENNPVNGIDPNGLDFIAVGDWPILLGDAPPFNDYVLGWHYSIEFWCSNNPGPDTVMSKDQWKYTQDPGAEMIGGYQLLEDRGPWWILVANSTLGPLIPYTPWISYIDNNSNSVRIQSIKEGATAADWQKVQRNANSYQWAEHRAGGQPTALTNWPHSNYDPIGSNSNTFIRWLVTTSGLSMQEFPGWHPPNPDPGPRDNPPRGGGTFIGTPVEWP